MSEKYEGCKFCRTLVYEDGDKDIESEPLACFPLSINHSYAVNRALGVGIHEDDMRTKDRMQVCLRVNGAAGEVFVHMENDALKSLFPKENGAIISINYCPACGRKFEHEKPYLEKYDFR